MARGELAAARRVARLLRERGVSVAAAEGATGGRLGERLTRYAGASAYFKGAVAAYDYAGRTTVLGMDAAELAAHGAVSEASVTAMAHRVRALFNADVGVACSGVAGPGGGSAEKPVGLVWLAVADARGVRTESHRLGRQPRLTLQGEFTRLALEALERAVR